VADEFLRDREKALEESFFAKRNQKLLEALREKRAREQGREVLAEVSGIADADVLDKLVELGIGAETWTALSLVPLVEVAWANGQVEEKERRAVLAGAEANGIVAGSPGYELLQGWLAQRPDARLLETWGEYIVGLRASLEAAEIHALRDEVLGRARAVAKAAGGFLGLGTRISSEEEVVLRELARAFDGPSR
jgi:hypothetical protein